MPTDIHHAPIATLAMSFGAHSVFREMPGPDETGWSPERLSLLLTSLILPLHQPGVKPSCDMRPGFPMTPRKQTSGYRPDGRIRVGPRTSCMTEDSRPS